MSPSPLEYAHYVEVNLYSEKESMASSTAVPITQSVITPFSIDYYMETPDINDYSKEQVCTYKNRRYYVRDNGAVYRQCKDDGKVRKWDEEWTFGKFDPNTGYMLIGQERVHRIVCTAYHGEPEGDKNVADHIDTNRCNNRPDNLRWVTKLENTLNNPITRAKVELICGSVEAFLENPELLYGHESENPNFTWMRAVSKEEAQRSLKRWSEWAAKPIEERKPKGEGVGEWIYEDETQPLAPWNSDRPHYLGPYRSWAEHKAAIEAENKRIYEEEYGLKDSLTPGAKQLNWKTPTEFLLCPGERSKRTLLAYLNNLVKGKVFCRTQYGDGGSVFDCGYNSADDAIYVLTHNQATEEQGFGKPWALCKITLKDGYYIHENHGSFFDPLGGEKYFTIAMGREWTGEDPFDDFC